MYFIKVYGIGNFKTADKALFKKIIRRAIDKGLTFISYYKFNAQAHVEMNVSRKEVA